MDPQREEEIKVRIAELLRKVTTEADPEQLNEYRSLFRKGVPLLTRSYVAAYLIMQLEEGAAAPRGQRRSRRGERGERGERAERGERTERGERGERTERGERLERGERAERGERSSVKPAVEKEAKGEGPRHEIPDEDAARLFVSIGRNRRVFPRELLGLILSETSVDKEDVGTIRILDNYSFIQVRKTVAEDIIAALDGKAFRGRSLAVNFAKPRKDADSDAAEGAAEELPEDDIDQDLQEDLPDELDDQDSQ
jgi:hypothetical protein